MTRPSAGNSTSNEFIGPDLKLACWSSTQINLALCMEVWHEFLTSGSGSKRVYWAWKKRYKTILFLLDLVPLFWPNCWLRWALCKSFLEENLKQEKPRNAGIISKATRVIHVVMPQRWLLKFNHDPKICFLFSEKPTSQHWFRGAVSKLKNIVWMSELNREENCSLLRWRNAVKVLTDS